MGEIAESPSREDSTTPFYKQRKWVLQSRPVTKFVRSQSCEEPKKALKPIECLSMLMTPNEAVIQKNKSRLAKIFRKSFTLPIIDQEPSSSDESLSFMKTNTDDHSYEDFSKEINIIENKKRSPNDINSDNKSNISSLLLDKSKEEDETQFQKHGRWSIAFDN